MGDFQIVRPTGASTRVEEIENELKKPMVFFDSSGGSFHILAKKALLGRQKEADVKLQAEYKTLTGKDLQGRQYIEVDMMKDILNIQLPLIGRLNIGNWCVKSWNAAQQKGNISQQRRLVALQWLAELLFFLIVYIKTRRLLKSLQIEPGRFVSTQALCTSAIVRAIQHTNKSKGRNLHLELHMTDMPRIESEHFLKSLKKIGKNKKLAPLVKLHVPSAYKDNEDSPKRIEEDKLMNRYSGKIKWVRCQQFPIRKTFLDKKAVEKMAMQTEFELKLYDGDAARLEHGFNHASKDRLKIDPTSGNAKIEIKSKDKVAMLVLGSQPTHNSVLDWIDTMVTEARAKEFISSQNDKTQHFFFVYCGYPDRPATEEDTEEINELLPIVTAKLRKLKESGKLPENLNIVPFLFQNDETQCPLMARSQLPMNRSGGGLAMENIHLHQTLKDINQTLGRDRINIIHSEGLRKSSHSTCRFSAAKEALICSLLGDEQPLQDMCECDEEEGVVEKTSSTLFYDWQQIKQAMLQAGLKKGVSAEDLEALIACLDANRSCSKEDRTRALRPHAKTLQKLSKALDQEVKRFKKKHKYVPLCPVEKEKMIKAKMKNLQKQKQYSKLEPDALRMLATERLLIEQGIPLWEAGNAEYVKDAIGAEIANPETARETIRKRFFGAHPSRISLRLAG